MHKKGNGIIPSGYYLLKVNNRNTRARCEICSKLTINTPERRFKHTQTNRRQIADDLFECVCSVVLVCLLLTLNIFHTLL